MLNKKFLMKRTMKNILFLVYLATYIGPCICQSSDRENVLFQDPDEFPVSLRVIDLQTHNESRLELIFNKNSLSKFNLTFEKINRGHVEVAADGNQDFVVDGERISLGIKTTTILSLNPNSSSALSLNLEHFQNMKMEDIEDDPNLIPMPQLRLKWNTAPQCALTNLDVSIKNMSVVVKVNNISITNITLKNLPLYGKTTHLLGEGILMLVLNPKTCLKTFESVMLTADFGGYRDLAWILDGVSPERVVVLASLQDGASLLPTSTRKKIGIHGSLWVSNYLHEDSWLSIFTKGGKMFQEVLIPNLEAYNTSIGSPIKSHINLIFKDDFLREAKGCLLWPKSRRWKARKVFCNNFDGFSELCSCDKPFELPNRLMLLQKGASIGQIPILIVAGRRTRHLFHLFQTIGNQKSVIRENFLIVTDDYHEEVNQLAFILGVKLLVHKPEGENATRISRTFRFTLFNALKVFPKAQAFIVLEDDLIVAPDFYSYMSQLFPLFEMDPTIFCVNAFSHLSYTHTIKDPTQLYRVTTYPAYGWMMSRNIVNQIVPKWLPASVSHDWDFFVGSNLVREERECIIPDINRSYHWATMGFHVKPSYFAESLFLSRPLNEDPGTKLPPLERLIIENYEKEYLGLLEKAVPLDDDKISRIQDEIVPGGIYVIFIDMPNKAAPQSLRLAGDILNLWNRDVRDVHNSSWRFNYRNSTVFVVGVPASPYQSFMPNGYPLLQGDEMSELEIDFAEFYQRSYLKFPTHENNYHFPIV